MKEAIRKIKKIKDAEGRLGYEICEADSLDGGCTSSYEDVGSSLLYLIKQNPDDIAIIEKTVIAICGYGFDSLLERMKEHKSIYDNL